MAENRSARSITVRPYEPRGLLQEGRLPVARPDGSELRRTASAFGTLATKLSGIADTFAAAEGERAGTIAGGEENFRPTGSLTIRGRAFDRAGTESYLSKLDANMRADMQTLYEQHQDDPDALRSGLDQMRELYRQKHVFPEIGPAFDSAFTRLSTAYRTRAVENFDTKQRGILQGELVKTLSDLTTTQSQQLASLDPNDPAAVDTLVSTQNAIDVQLDRAVEQNLMTPASAEEEKARSRREAAVKFYLGQAAGLSDPRDIAAFGEAVQKSYSEGKLAGVDAAGYDDLIAGVSKMGAQAETRGRTAARAVGTRLKSYVERVAAGLNVPPDEWASIQIDAGISPEGEKLVGVARQQLTYAKIIRDQPVGVAEEAVRKLRESLAGGASAEQAEILSFAETQLAAAKDLIDKDPLAAAERRGLIPSIAPIDVSEGLDEAKLAGQVAARVAQADAVAETFGRTPRYLRSGEAKIFQELLASDPESAATAAAGLIAGAGDHATAVLGEISDSAPELGAAVDVVQRGGDPAMFDALVRQRQLERDPAYKRPTIAPAPRETAIANVYGPAMAALPSRQAALVSNAESVFLTLSRERGLPPDASTSEGKALYEEALQKAAGATFPDGVQHGGVTEVNGFPTLAPVGFRADQVEEVFNGLTDAQLAALPPIKTGNGAKVTAADLSGAELIAVGDGLYRVRIGNRFVAAADGGFWTLDIRKLASLPRPAETAPPVTGDLPYGIGVP